MVRDNLVGTIGWKKMGGRNFFLLAACFDREKSAEKNTGFDV